MTLLQSDIPYTDTSSSAIFYVVGLLVAVAVFLVVYRWTLKKLGVTASGDDVRRRRQMYETFAAKGYRIWVYRPASRTYSYLQADGNFGAPMNPVKFLEPYHRDDFEAMRAEVFAICDGKHDSGKVTLRSKAEAGQTPHHYEVHISVALRRSARRPTLLLGIMHDITDDYHRQQTVNQLLLRYHTVFNSSLVDMIYYDRNGVLTDINERACKAFNVPSRDYAIEQKFLLENNPIFHKIPLEQMRNTRTSSIVDLTSPEFDDEKYKLDELRLRKKIYYESTINPIRNQTGRLEGVFMVGRDITEMVESYHRQQEGNRRLQQVSAATREYLANINYALRVSNVQMVNYYPKSYYMEITSTVGESRVLRLSQLRCIRLATPRFRRTVNSLLNRMDHLTSHPITQAIETELRDQQGRQVWLYFNLVPMRDESGNIVRYFGMFRPITDVIETERRLEIETKKAQETELLKQVFLTNMSYEIRTPLNNIVGFADLFANEHDEADEPFFTEQIKESTQALLLLVNDILYISKLDAHLVEYHYDYTDFAPTFESYCMLGLSTIQPGVDTKIGRPYTHLVVNIDDQMVGDIVKRLCTIATIMTTKGRISTNYEYHHGQLIISVEDTGKGIAREVLPHAFDRFGHDDNNEMCGSGLDLPIIKAEVEQMGGTIEIESEQGKGSTVWVSIPCEARQVERQRDNSTNSSEPITML